MSQQNVEIVRRLVEAFYDRDVETAASMLDAEIEFESAYVYEALLSSEGDRFLSAAGERVHLYRIVGRGKGSGVPVAQDIAILWTLRAGRVVRGKAFLDQTDALEAVGLRE